MEPIALAYLAGIGLNVLALGYALSNGQVPYAVAFGLAIVYLVVRLRMHAGE